MPTISELFEVTYGNKFDFNKMTVDPDGVNFVGRAGKKQGVSGSVALIPGADPYPAGLITVALGGASRLASFVQQFPFYTAQNVAVLTPRNPEMGIKERLWWAMCIQANRFRYEGFGREANRTLGTIGLPEKTPDWVETSMLPNVDAMKQPQVNVATELPHVSGWKTFRLDELFEIKKGSRLTKRQQRPGPVPYLGASARNNSITSLIDATPQFPANTIAVPYNGSTGFATYQSRPFCAGDDIHVLIPRENLSPLVLLFLCTVIRREGFRYHYGYKWNLTRMVEDSVRLPQQNGAPDWVLIDTYMKALPYSNAIAQG
jgi:hypothetical protein